MKSNTSIFTLISLAFLICSGCASPNKDSLGESNSNITNNEIISVSSGVATAWLINPIAGVVVGVGSYYLLEEGE